MLGDRGGTVRTSSARCRVPRACAAPLLVSCGGEPRLVPPADPSLQMTTERLPLPGQLPWARRWRRGSVDDRLGDRDRSSDQCADRSRLQLPARCSANCRRRCRHLRSPPGRSWRQPGSTTTPLSTLSRPALYLADSACREWISFYIERDPDVPWPVGTYEVTVSLDGATVQQAAVEVRE